MGLFFCTYVVGAVDKPSAAWGKKRHKMDKKEPPGGTNTGLRVKGQGSANLTLRTGHAAFREACCIYKRPQACFGFALQRNSIVPKKKH